MAYLFLIIAIVAALGAVVLLRLASKQEKQADLADVPAAELASADAELADDVTSDADLEDTEVSSRYAQPVVDAPEDQPDYHAAPAAGQESDNEEDYDTAEIEVVVESESESEPEEELEQDSEEELEQDPEEEPEAMPAARERREARDEPTWEVFPAQSVVEAADEGEADEHREETTKAHGGVARKPQRRGLFANLHLPGTMHRYRKEWAQDNGFEMSKSDDYLVDEWFRGAAATGAVPKDIVSGEAYGHELVLMDLGGVNVMAMRTGAASDEVVDFRREDLEATESSDDLMEAVNVCGFDIFATDAGVAQRMIDPRVEAALEAMPEEVTAVWMESEWVLAQYEDQSRPQHWEDTLAPLAMLADVARVLPPRSSAAQTLRFEDADPSREMPEKTPLSSVPVGAGAAGLHVVKDGDTGNQVSDDEEGEEQPLVQRPDEPTELPTRKTAVSHGDVELRPLGGDEVDAIADGNERPQIDADMPRVPRNLPKSSSIFDDLIERYGDIMSFDDDAAEVAEAVEPKEADKEADKRSNNYGNYSD